MNYLEALCKHFYHPSDLLWKAVELQAVAKSRVLNDLPRPILDLGCEDGKLMEVLLGKNQVDYGLDLDPDKYAYQVYKKVIKADLQAVPLPDRSIGTIISFVTLHLVPDIDMTFKEIYRLLKPGGKLIFTVPNANFSDNLFISQVLKRVGLNGLAIRYVTWRNRQLENRYLYASTQWKKYLVGLKFKEISCHEYLTGTELILWDQLALLTKIGFLYPKINQLLDRNMAINLNYLILTGLINRDYHNKIFCGSMISCRK